MPSLIDTGGPRVLHGCEAGCAYRKWCGTGNGSPARSVNLLLCILVILAIALTDAVTAIPISELIGVTGMRAERSANLSHITGASRKIQMYIKNRHLQILPDGSVNGSNDDTSDYTIFQRTSVSRGQLRIQGVATCLYLCMDSCGLLYGSREYTEDCLFNETLEQHNYNTYSSVRWSTAKKTLYLGLNRRGQPRRVQAKGHNLGRLSAYARVLTQVAPPERVETLHRRMLGAEHGLRHRHSSHSHGSINRHHRPGEQSLCPVQPAAEKDGRDRFRCRKRKKRKKRRRHCRPDEPANPECEAIRQDNPEGSGQPAQEPTQPKGSREDAASEEARRREALTAPAAKRKTRIKPETGKSKNDDGGVMRAISLIKKPDLTNGEKRRKPKRLPKRLPKTATGRRTSTTSTRSTTEASQTGRTTTQRTSATTTPSWIPGFSSLVPGHPPSTSSYYSPPAGAYSTAPFADPTDPLPTG